MNRCPQCQRVYQDTSLSFCLQDGTLLITDVPALTEVPPTIASPFAYDNSPTMKHTFGPNVMQGSDASPEYESPGLQHPAVSTRKRRPLLWIIGLLAVLIIGIGAAIVISRGLSTDNGNVQESKRNNNGSVADKPSTPASPDTNVTTNSDKAKSETDRSDPLHKIVGRWRMSKEGGDIEVKSDGTAIYSDVGSGSALYGFKRGDLHLTNIRPVANGFEAMTMTRAEVVDCPTLRPLAVKASIRLDSAGNTLYLNATGMRYRSNSCSWASVAGELMNLTYSRIE